MSTKKELSMWMEMKYNLQQQKEQYTARGEVPEWFYPEMYYCITNLHKTIKKAKAEGMTESDIQDIKFNLIGGN